MIDCKMLLVTSNTILQIYQGRRTYVRNETVRGQFKDMQLGQMASKGSDVNMDKNLCIT